MPTPACNRGSFLEAAEQRFGLDSKLRGTTNAGLGRPKHRARSGTALIPPTIRYSTLDDPPNLLVLGSVQTMQRVLLRSLYD